MVQLVLLPVALLLLYVIVSAAGTVVLVFLVSSVIALILNPLVKLVERAHIPHGLAVAAVFLFFFAAFAGAVLLLIQPASDQVAAFQHDVPGLVKSANHTLADFQHWLDDHNINVQIKKQGQTALGTLQSNVLKGSGDVVSFGRDLLQRLVEGAFALILVLVVSVYMLLYAESIGGLVRQVMPTGDGTPEDDFPIRAQKAVSSYVRGQLLFSVIMGTTAGVALYIFGVLGIFPDGRSYALFFGVFFGLMELIPYVGPVLGAVPPIVVAPAAGPADRGLGGAALPRAAADRGAHRRAAGVRVLAAPEPDHRDLRVAVRGRGLRDHRRVHRAAARGRPARDRRLPQPPSRVRGLVAASGGERIGPARARVACPACRSSRSPPVA